MAIIPSTPGDDTLDGFDSADTIDGGLGADTMSGGKGNDVYYVDNIGDVVIENPGEGTDLVYSTIDFTLGANVENLVLTGLADIVGTGNSLVNTITGNSGDNTLDGGAGVDTLKGGIGDDTYIVDLLLSGKNVKLEDKITENKTEGTDTLMLRASGDLGLAAGTKVTIAKYFENLDISLTGSNKLNLVGGSDNNTLTGNDWDNTLDGGAGADTLIGGLGDDVYIFDSLGDVVSENGGEGTDTVQIAYKNASKTAAITVDMNVAGFANVENVKITGTGLFNITGTTGDNVLTGNSSANTLIGGGGNDTFDGGTGADFMSGGAGDDTYYVDSTADVISDSGGTDTVVVVLKSGVYTLADGLENLTLTGKTSAGGRGNASDNVLTGNDGNNLLDGGAGADTMIGGLGNDTYIVDDAGDVVTESSAAGGADLVQSSVSFTLGANIESLTLTGSGNIDATGNALANTLTGNTGDNTLDGGLGADTMKGGRGNDTYVADLLLSSGTLKLEDKITENTNEGTDTLMLRTGGTYSLNDAVKFVLGSNLENFDISLTHENLINLDGNTLNNVMIGNDGDNILFGSGGNDALYGGLGDDVLNGGIGNDTLVGGSGVDALFGGTGNDRFYYTAAGQSNLGSLDLIADFASGDKISFAGASGYSMAGGSYGWQGSVAATVAAIAGDGGVDDKGVYFTDGSDGYLYIKGDGDGLGTSYDGTLIALANRTSALGSGDVEFDLVIEDETQAATAFAIGQSVAGALSSVSDVDKFSFHADDGGFLTLHLDVPVSNIPGQPAYHVELLNAAGGVINQWSVSGDGDFMAPLQSGGDYTVSITGTAAAQFNAGEYGFTADVTTPVSMTVGVDAHGSISTAGEIDFFAIDLTAGTLYTFDLTGDGSGLDPKIRIYDDSGRQLLVRDDTGYTHGQGNGTLLDAYAGFTAPHSGTYYISVAAVYEPDSPLKEELLDIDGDVIGYGGISPTGSYTLAVTAQDAGDIGHTAIAGPRWNGETTAGTGVTITYSFSATLPSEMQGQGSFYNLGSYKGMTAAQQAAVTNALQLWSNVADITFVQVAPGTGELNFGLMNSFGGSTGSGFVFESGNSNPTYGLDGSPDVDIAKGDVILGYSGTASKLDLSTNDNMALLIHEIGHALGLEHPGNYSTEGGVPVSVDNLPTALDNRDYADMAYAGRIDQTIEPTTPQIADIAAMQQLYGANTSYASGDTTWSFNSTTTQYLQTIWDSGGNDTIDASGQSLSVTIHLEGGSLSSIGIFLPPPGITATDILQVKVDGDIFDRAYQNVGIAFGTLIENAKGGGGDDYISGNSVANRLEGNGGDDVLVGGAGDDTLIGGDGNDILIGGGDDDVLTGGAGNDTFWIDSGAGVASISDFASGEDKLVLADILTGEPIGTLDTDAFGAGSTATTADQRVLYDSATGNLYVDADGNGGGSSPVLIANLGAGTSLAADDIILALTS